MTTSETMFDALIVGSGPGGLSVALGLSRTHRRAAIFTKPGGAGFRNEGAHEMHNFISRDGIAPEEFRQIATEQIKKYGTVDFIEAEIVAMEKIEFEAPTSFTVTSKDGKVWKGRKLALAMGSIETLPDIEGYILSHSNNRLTGTCRMQLPMYILRRTRALPPPRRNLDFSVTNVYAHGPNDEPNHNSNIGTSHHLHGQTCS
jgi:hypothetical protein